MKERDRAILIVEDDYREQFIIKTIFEELGVQEPVYIVNDGVEAMDFLNGRGKYANRDEFRFPTVLLTDLKMPRMSGLELLLYIKRSRLVIVPTIVLTNSQDPDDIKHAYLIGANAYHIKASSLEKLREQLQTLHRYWTGVDLPAVDKAGLLLPTRSEGKMGAHHPIVFDYPTDKKPEQ